MKNKLSFRSETEWMTASGCKFIHSFHFHFYHEKSIHFASRKEIIITNRKLIFEISPLIVYVYDFLNSSRLFKQEQKHVKYYVQSHTCHQLFHSLPECSSLDEHEAQVFALKQLFGTNIAPGYASLFNSTSTSCSWTAASIFNPLVIHILMNPHDLQIGLSLSRKVRNHLMFLSLLPSIIYLQDPGKKPN